MSEKDNYLQTWLEDLPEKMGSPAHYANYLICMNALLGIWNGCIGVISG
jgi:hypothetical protein